MIKSYVKRIARKIKGKQQPERYISPQFSRLADLFKLYGVDFVFDVGANAGQSGINYRNMGYQGPIVSLEPISYLYEQLLENSKADSLWTPLNIAAGNSDGKTEINVSGGHAGASSIREMTNNVIQHAPDQKPIRKETITLTPLDSLIAEHYPQGNSCFVKIDVQGFENEVLEGLNQSQEKIVGMQVESSIVKNYEGESLFIELLPRILSMGYSLVGLEQAWGNSKTKEIYQVDGLFFRADKLQSPTM